MEKTKKNLNKLVINYLEKNHPHLSNEDISSIIQLVNNRISQSDFDYEANNLFLIPNTEETIKSKIDENSSAEEALGFFPYI